MTLWEDFKLVLFILFLISIPLTLVGMVGMFAGMFPEQTSYEYEVKAQQVFDGDRVQDSDVTEFENLSEDEREILYQAFKKTDHFMGSSEVVVYESTRHQVFNDWRTVESNGVLLLVAVQETKTSEPDPSEYTWFHWLVVGSMVYCLLGVFRLFMFPPGP
jgi:hypothetical protein